MSKQSVNKKAPRKKAANGYKLPDPIPEGEVLTDIGKKKWKIGPSIGTGGFGEIYSAVCLTDKTESKNYNFVIKIEPHGNGPLFVEMHFYMRNAKSEDIDAWVRQNKLTSLGMPKYIGSGSHECKGQKYRFVVMERFGRDIWNLFLENNRAFRSHTVFRVAIQILDVLQYIHSRGYVHADIKGGNILLGLGSKEKTQVYLVDFGLASHFTTKEFKPDPKKAHNGTIEYTSRDAHNGVLTRRGDLEILAYNMLQWLGCSLPWEKNLTDTVAVQQQKEKFFSDVGSSLKTHYLEDSLPDALVKFFKYVKGMNYDTEPDYSKCRSIFLSGIKESGGSLKLNLDFSNIKKSKVSPRKSPKTKTKKINDDEIESSETPKKARKIVSKKGKSSELIDNIEPVKKRVYGRKNNAISETSESDVETTPQKIVVKNKRVQKWKNVYDEDNVDEVLHSEKKTPQKSYSSAESSRRTRRTPVNYAESDSDIFDDTSIDEKENKRKSSDDYSEHTPNKLKKLASAETCVKGEKKKTTLKVNTKSSWKDCPTIRNGRVQKPGVYKAQ